DEETRYIDNSNDALDIRPEQYINLRVIAKLIAIDTMSTNNKERKRANTSETGSLLSEDSVAKDKKLQEEQDK
ncbi:823_t:CDS:2, partial [Racocetra fulgida]